jgi:hypothetical protein
MDQKFPNSDNNLTKLYLADFLVNRLIFSYQKENLDSSRDLTPLTFLEPGCGELLPFTTAALMHKKYEAINITSIEYRPVEDSTVLTGIDFLNPEDDAKWRQHDTYKIIATNPPFSKGKAVAFIRRGLELLHGRGYMGFLLGLNFLASEERRVLYKEHPPHEVIVIQHRPEFIRPWDGKRGTDAREYCFLIWRGVAIEYNHTVLSWTDIRDPDKKIKNLKS